MRVVFLVATLRQCYPRPWVPWRGQVCEGVQLQHSSFPAARFFFFCVPASVQKRSLETSLFCFVETDLIFLGSRDVRVEPLASGPTIIISKHTCWMSPGQVDGDSDGVFVDKVTYNLRFMLQRSRKCDFCEASSHEAWGIYCKSTTNFPMDTSPMGDGSSAKHVSHWLLKRRRNVLCLFTGALCVSMWCGAFFHDLIF
ncbi:hypothetical protein F4781DRAFT_261078 [Annulohypoxylon bovei var. microspora]|nr:hypothetical protein F4781DRAFT_261078 [Annulohypoxylon bovei var. microspora]